MTKLKRFTSVLIAVMMVLVMSIGVFAAGENATITVKNATPGKTYELYKVFDADVVGSSVTYKVKADSPWAEAIDSAAPFTLSATADANGYKNVVINDNVTDATVIAWVKAKAASITANTSVTVKADETAAVFDKLDYGYYFVSTTNGSIVSIDNLKSENVEITDKSLVPSWDPAEPTPGPKDPPPSGTTNIGKFVATGENPAASDYTDKVTASVGETEHFMVNAFVPMYSEGCKVVAYTITDDWDSSFTIDADSIKVSIDGTDCTSLVKVVVDATNCKFTVSYNIADIPAYKVDSHISIKYTGALDSDTVNIANFNRANMTWTQIDPTKPLVPGTPDPADPETPVPPVPEITTPPSEIVPPEVKTETDTYGFKLQKVDGAGTQIGGAEFSVTPSGSSDAVSFVSVDDNDNSYRVADAAEMADDTVTKVTNIPVGYATIFGLKEGTYTLEETKVPATYNKAPNKDITVNAASTAADADPVVIENLQGIILPSTGGIGTRVFYVTGAVVMLGAVVLLVAKKRTSDKK